MDRQQSVIYDGVVTEQTRDRRRSGRSFPVILRNVLLALLFSLILAATIIAAFFKTVADDIPFFALADLGNAGIWTFITSVYPLILCLILLPIVLLLLILANKESMQRIFQVVGWTLLASGAVCVILGWLGSRATPVFSSALHDVLAGIAPPLTSLLFAAAMFCFVMGAFFVFLGLVIMYVKRETTHE